MTVEQVAKRLVLVVQQTAGGEQTSAFLRELRMARYAWLEEERLAILALVKAWIGDTVEGRDLETVIKARAKKSK